MSARLDGEGRVFARLVEAYRFVDDVFIAPLKAAVLSAARRDKRRQPVRSDRVGDDRPRPFGEKNGGNEGDEAVAVDFLAVFIYGARLSTSVSKIIPKSAPYFFTASQTEAMAVSFSGLGIWLGKRPSGSRNCEPVVSAPKGFSTLST